MNRDDIIRMAQEAEMGFDTTAPQFIAELERFATLAAAAEREACAIWCDEEGWLKCAAGIRDRGKA